MFQTHTGTLLKSDKNKSLYKYRLKRYKNVLHKKIKSMSHTIDVMHDDRVNIRISHNLVFKLNHTLVYTRAHMNKESAVILK